MEIVRYLNGVEISRDELYSRSIVTDEIKSAMNDVRARMGSKHKTSENENERSTE